MRKLIMCSVVGFVFALAGCSTIQGVLNESSTTPTMNLSGATPAPTDATSSTPGSTPSPTPTRTTPTPTPTPVDIPAGACLSPSDGVLTWVRSGFGEIPTSSIVVVEAGPGNREGETWNVVAFVGSNGVTRVSYSYLTNIVPDQNPADATWIDIGNTRTPAWDNVAWTGDRLDTGKQAQRIAFACLGQ